MQRFSSVYKNSRYTEFGTAGHGLFFKGDFRRGNGACPVFEESTRKQMPRCSYRKYTVSEIINSVINNGFMLKKFDEHPAWTNEDVPGEFTVVASKG